MYKEMEAPCPCQNCGEWFDLNDGYRSEKWFPNTVICEECHDLEEKEIEIDDEEQELVSALDDAIFTVNQMIDCLKDIKRPHNCYFSVLPSYTGNEKNPLHTAVTMLIKEYSRKLIFDNDKFFKELNSKVELLNSEFPQETQIVLSQFYHEKTGDINFILNDGKYRLSIGLNLLLINPFSSQKEDLPF